MSVCNQDILKLLGLATCNTIVKVSNKYAKEQFLVHTSEGIFDTAIDLKLVYIKTKVGWFNTEFKLIQIKFYTEGEVIFLGEDKDFLNGYFYELFLSPSTTIDVPKGGLQVVETLHLSEILPRFKSI